MNWVSKPGLAEIGRAVVVRPRSLLRMAWCLAAAVVLAGAPGTGANAAGRGTVTGGVAHPVPHWFKASFLEIADDVAEATAADRHLMVFFQLNDCPYCDRMLTECFETDPYMSFIRAHFDVIAINVHGDREVVFDERTTVAEKELADLLKVRATPAIVFLGEGNKQVARVNGYRSPQHFQQVLDYVSSKAYRSTTLADYLERNRAKGVYELRGHELFRDISDLSAVDGPLAVVFEDTSCHDCAEFHERTLEREEVMEELRKFTVVRLNTDSGEQIVAPSGERTTARELAESYQMTYRPGVLLFDDGKLIRRHDSLVYHFHFAESLRYVGGGYHRAVAYRDYQRRHREELLSKGVDVDFSR